MVRVLAVQAEIGAGIQEAGVLADLRQRETAACLMHGQDGHIALQRAPQRACLKRVGGDQAIVTDIDSQPRPQSEQRIAGNCSGSLVKRDHRLHWNGGAGRLQHFHRQADLAEGTLDRYRARDLLEIARQGADSYSARDEVAGVIHAARLTHWREMTSADYVTGLPWHDRWPVPWRGGGSAVLAVCRAGQEYL